MLKDGDAGGGERNVFNVSAVSGMLAFGSMLGSYRLYERVKG